MLLLLLMPFYLLVFLLLLLFSFVFMWFLTPFILLWHTAVQDDAAPGTQEYIMLRQDSIHSADIRSKGSPFRAKCHEIFCCPLKQVVHKESTEPEGLFAPLLVLICRCSSLPLATLISPPLHILSLQTKFFFFYFLFHF